MKSKANHPDQLPSSDSLSEARRGSVDRCQPASDPAGSKGSRRLLRRPPGETRLDSRCGIARCAALVLTCLAVAMAGRGLGAELWLPACFGDNMVLPAGESLLIWGRSDLRFGEVRFGERSFPWKADEVQDGKPGLKWTVEIKMPGVGGPVLIQVRAAKSRKLLQTQPDVEVQLTNVMVGEIWVHGSRPQGNAPVPAWTPEELRSLASVRFVRMPRLRSATALVSRKGPAWKPFRPTDDSVATTYFLRQLAGRAGPMPIGVISVPWLDVTSARATTNAAPDRLLGDLRASAARQAGMLASNALSLHLSAVSRLKFTGVVTTEQPPPHWEDIRDFEQLRLGSPEAFDRFTVRGWIW